MVRNFLFIAAAFILFTQAAVAKSCGIALFSENGKKFKVYANGTLQNNSFMSEVRVCCFQDERVEVKLVFEDNSRVEGTVFLRKGFMEYDRVTDTKMEFDHYERLPEEMKNSEKIELLPVPIARKKTPYVAKPTCTTPLSNASFYEFFTKLKEDDGFDEDKLRKAKSSISVDCFTSKQIMMVLSGFARESTKLEFAKYAYDYVYDKNEFNMVKDGFSYTRTGEKLDEYIRQNR